MSASSSSRSKSSSSRTTTGRRQATRRPSEAVTALPSTSRALLYSSSKSSL